jgi:hypothetical protein
LRTLAPHATWTGIDASEPMLGRAREAMPVWSQRDLAVLRAIRR